MKKILLLGLLIGAFGIGFANIHTPQQVKTKINPTLNYQMIHPTNIETPTGYPLADRTFLN
ncbi:MAG: hypothetical protein K2Y14_07720 [Burkholderiales bacterium]|nr:hypothetical protein [Burkholderiales bacterium]